ncbi:hypothetical protein SAMN05446037_101913 [Anaerovirgula multivorans]|uniref:Uncharacterized protein n=1 Tax=Anaerovirgula multivorans TaxID=312168 RepID=A0A239H043_9FIRM|nr:hypothetical protein [Anaerovirgula multivorans]SNS73654.1 hypothetical protein SAMN05446037_101913 [Anaerovirgula multivorans]
MNNKTRVAIGLLTFVLGTLVFTGCTSQSKEGLEQDSIGNQREDLVIAIGSEPDGGFDPVIGWMVKAVLEENGQG